MSPAARELLDDLHVQGSASYKANPARAAWELADLGLAYFVSGPSWTLILTHEGAALQAVEGVEP